MREETSRLLRPSCGSWVPQVRNIIVHEVQSAGGAEAAELAGSAQAPDSAASVHGARRSLDAVFGRLLQVRGRPRVSVLSVRVESRSHPFACAHPPIASRPASSRHCPVCSPPWHPAAWFASRVPRVACASNRSTDPQARALEASLPTYHRKKMPLSFPCLRCFRRTRAADTLGCGALSQVLRNVVAVLRLLSTAKPAPASAGLELLIVQRVTDRSSFILPRREPKVACLCERLPSRGDAGAEGAIGAKRQ
jgi:hypothetical protein